MVRNVLLFNLKLIFISFYKTLIKIRPQLRTLSRRRETINRVFDTYRIYTSKTLSGRT